MRARATATIALLAGATGAAGACGVNNPTYVPATMALEVGGTDPATGMALPTTATNTLSLVFRQPTSDEQKQLDDQTAALGAAGPAPWLREDQIHIEVRYTVTNLDDSQGAFALDVDGANEFSRYDEDAVSASQMVGGEMPNPIALVQTIPQTLAPGQVYQGTIREDDFHEASIDLDAIGRWMAPYAEVLINRSDQSRLGLEMVPPNAILPAMWELKLHFSSGLHMRCEFLARVRDDGDRLWSGNGPQFMPMPVDFMPPPPPPMM